jgi:excisionase family DNA binding protein
MKMNATHTDLGRLLAELVRPIIREEIRAAVAEARSDREERAEPVYLDTAGAVTFTGMSAKHLERLARAGKIKAHRAGRHLRWKHEDLVAYIEGAK